MVRQEKVDFGNSGGVSEFFHEMAGVAQDMGAGVDIFLQQGRSEDLIKIRLVDVGKNNA